MKPKGSGASADRSLLVLVSVALATSLFAHLNRWGACSHIHASLDDPRRLPHQQAHRNGGGAAPCTPSLGDSDASSGPSTHATHVSSSSSALSGGCPVCDASDVAKEDNTAVALRLQLESRDGEVARARRDLQDMVGPGR